MNNEQEITRKQAELYKASLAAFIEQSRKSVEKTRQYYQNYVDRNFAKLKSNNGIYTISQGQNKMTINMPNIIASRKIGIR